MTNTIPTPVTWSPDALAAAGLKTSHDARIWLESMGENPAEVSDAELPEAIQRVKDKQEVLSRKYSSDCLIVLPLASGNLALISLDRQAHEILSKEEFVDRIGEISKMFGLKMKMNVMHAERLRSIGVSEPDATAQARDIRRASKPPAQLRLPRSASSAIVDFDASSF
jgi:hypothetical protein